MMLTDTDAAGRIAGKLKAQDRTLWEKIKDFFTGLVEKLRNAYQDAEPDSEIARILKRAVQDNEALAEAWASAVVDAGENYQLQDGQKKNAQEGVRYSVRTAFANELQEWFDTTTHDERKESGKRFLVGTTTDVLESIGVRDYQIYFGGSKIDKILEKNSSMSLDTIKRAVNLLEDPILIMQSRTVDDSIVLFGDVYTSGGKPVMLSLLLNPKNKSGEILNYAVITSTYGRRTNNLQNLLDSSQIYYVNEDKNRTDGWLQALGLQLPSAVTKLGSIGEIADLNGNVNTGNEDTVFSEDIRYSQRTREGTQVDRLAKQNEVLGKEVEYLKQLVQIQKNGNRDHILDRNSVRQQARLLIVSSFIDEKGYKKEPCSPLIQKVPVQRPKRSPQELPALC